MIQADTLKSGWKLVKFGDVVRQVKDKVDPKTSGLERYVAGEHMNTDDLRIQRWGEIGDDYLGPAFHMRFKPGQVLYGSRRTYLRKVAVPDFEGICANTTFVLESKNPNVLLPELLPFIMQTEVFHEHSIKQSKGSVNPYINFTDLEWWEFPLPPISEQTKLARLLWILDKVQTKYLQTVKYAEELIISRIESFLKEIYTSSLILPVNKLLLEEPRNGFSPVTNDSQQGLRTVSISAISSGCFIVDGNIKYANINKERVEQFLVHKDDVFVIRGNGNRYLTGKCGITNKSYDDIFYPDLLIRLRFNKSKIIPEFAVLQWNMPSVHRQLLASAKSTNGIWKINGQDIRKHKLLVPSLDIQKKILSEIESIKAAFISIEEQRKNVLALKNFVINKQLLNEYDYVQRSQHRRSLCP
jgi:type I restriction enzyme S subunit